MDNGWMTDGPMLATNVYVALTRASNRCANQLIINAHGLQYFKKLLYINFDQNIHLYTMCRSRLYTAACTDANNIDNKKRRHFLSCMITIWTVFARYRDTAMPAEGNGDSQTLICVLVARPRRRSILSNHVPWQNWMAAYLGHTLRMKTLFRDWPIMVHDTHTRRRLEDHTTTYNNVNI